MFYFFLNPLEKKSLALRQLLQDPTLFSLHSLQYPSCTGTMRRMLFVIVIAFSLSLTISPTIASSSPNPLFLSPADCTDSDFSVLPRVKERESDEARLRAGLMNAMIYSLPATSRRSGHVKWVAVVETAVERNSQEGATWMLFDASTGAWVHSRIQMMTRGSPFPFP